MKSFFLLAALVVVVPRLLLAQSTAHTSDRRPFFVDFRGGYNNCEIRYQTSNGVVDINTFPFSAFPFTVGYHLKPRLAVQFGGVYGHTSEDSPGSTMQVPGGMYSENRHYTHHHGAIPILLRYAVLPKGNRLQVDALLGLMWAYDSYNNVYQSTFNGIILDEQTRSDYGSQFIATAGIGFRYAFSRHFELMYDHAWNRNLDGAPPAIRQQIIGNANGITSNRSIALRYRFNWGKPKSQPAAQ